MPYAAMIAVLSYVLVYGFGLGPIPYFIASGLDILKFYLTKSTSKFVSTDTI